MTQERTAKKFKNFSNEDFTWKFDGVPYTFPAGGEMYLESERADHFALHLIDRELNKAGKLTNDKLERAKLLEQCFPTVDVVSAEKALDINEKKKEKKAKKVEAEFEDLSTN